MNNIDKSIVNLGSGNVGNVNIGNKQNNKFNLNKSSCFIGFILGVIASILANFLYDKIKFFFNW